MQTPLDEQRGQTDSVRTAGTGSRYSHVDATQLEQAAKVHRYGRVHRLEDGTRAYEAGVLLLAHHIDTLHHGIGTTVVTIEQAYGVCVDVFLVEPGHLQRIGCGQIGILCLLGHIHTVCTVYNTFQVGGVELSCQSRLETHLFADGVKYDTGLSCIQGLLHLVQCLSEAGVDTHAGNYYSSVVHYPILYKCFFNSLKRRLRLAVNAAMAFLSAKWKFHTPRNLTNHRW